jgi:hypothetical protein
MSVSAKKGGEETSPMSKKVDEPSKPLRPIDLIIAKAKA